MKKKSVIYIFVALFSLLFNSFVLAEDEEREVIDLTKDKYSYVLNGYTNCSFPDSDASMANNVSITNNSGNAVFLKLADPAGDAADVGKVKTYSVTCTPVLYQNSRVQFNLEMTLVSQEEASKDGDYIDYSTKIDKSTLFPMYKSCKFSGANDRYIKIENQSNGVYITIIKSSSFSKESVELDCVTKQGNDAKMHLKIAKNAITGNDGLNGAGHEESSNNNSSNSNGSSKDSDNSNNYEWGDPKKDCNFIFGDFSTPGTFGNMLRQILKFIQFLGPILVIVLTILDLVKAVASDDKDALTKLLKKTSKRLIYAVLLFVFPAILDKILKWTNVYGTCTILE